jgi:uncharacterized lipoprotein YddW (UPF0748 family)
LLLSVFFAGAALAQSPVGLLNSQYNAGVYQEQHLGTYDDDFAEFKRTLGGANVRYDELADADAVGGRERLGKFKTIIVPMLVNLAPDAVSGLTDYVRGGGKLIIMDGGGTPGGGAVAINQLAGVTVDAQNTFKDPAKLTWTNSPLPMSDSIAVGTMVAHVVVSPEAKTLAKWEVPSGTSPGSAVVRKNNVAFLGWAPGLQGDIGVNSRYISMVLDDLSPGITQEAAVQISYAEYQTIKEELEYLSNRTLETIKTAKQAEFVVPYRSIQSDYDTALKHVALFHTAYKDRRFYEADQDLVKARQYFALAFGQAMPVRPVEARSVWLDRGTIVATKNPRGMVELFDKLKAAGINVVYFETNNAGFTMYPSNLTEQNPETKGWDPLGTAVNEAKKRGMEIHAWFWSFAVGNTRHNPIIGKEPDYPGPVLSHHDMNWALNTASGTLVPPKQHEFWLDASNPECRKYIKDLISETIQRYPVDGIQLDYIRYPFNNKGSECGFNWLSRTRFEQETGLSLDRLDDNTRELFTAWKVHQVNQLVREVSEMIRAQKPKLRISAAVYAFPRRMRINAIQQDWETWVMNGWIDTLNPMTYSHTPQDLSNMAKFCRESTQDKTLVYPGLAIMRVDMAGLIEQLDTARATGTLGTTMFAAAHLDDKKLNVLKLGPYRRQTLLTPQSEPIRASRFLVDDFAAMVNRYLQDPKTHILSDTASTNDVLNQIEALQKAMHSLDKKSTEKEIDVALKDVSSLHSTVKEWLRLEAFIQRGFRARYIVDYLSQVEAILSYASHKAKNIAGAPQTMAGNSTESRR